MSLDIPDITVQSAKETSILVQIKSFTQFLVDEGLVNSNLVRQTHPDQLFNLIIQRIENLQKILNEFVNNQANDNSEMIAKIKAEIDNSVSAAWEGLLAWGYDRSEIETSLFNTSRNIIESRGGSYGE